MSQPPLVPPQHAAWQCTTRSHDLPPLWNGNPVKWTEWAMPPVTTLTLHRPRMARAECCPRCGYMGEHPEACGTVTGARHAPAGLRSIYGGRLIATLWATRCPRCGHDQVIDSAGGVWDLDESDYLDEGSWSR